MSAMSLQGRLLEAETFPSPAHMPTTFSSRSRVLIDLGSALIVLTLAEEGRPPYQRNQLFRLEKNPSDVSFVDDSHLSKHECEELLRDVLSSLPECQIVGVQFPCFDQIDKVKYRPCVALYGDGNTPPLFLAAFSTGAPRSGETARYDWEIPLRTPEDITPNTASTQMVDVTKLCTMPTHYNIPGSHLHEEETWHQFQIGEKRKRSFLASTDPSKLRTKIIDCLVDLLRNNAFVYVDSTREIDVGTWVKELIWEEKEGLSTRMLKYNLCEKQHQPHSSP